MGGAEVSGVVGSPGGASSLFLHSGFLLWLSSSSARSGVAKEKMGSCHLTERKAASGQSEHLSVTTLPGPGKLSEASVIPPLPSMLSCGWVLASSSFRRAARDSLLGWQLKGQHQPSRLICHSGLCTHTKGQLESQDSSFSRDKSLATVGPTFHLSGLGQVDETLFPFPDCMTGMGGKAS